MQIKDCWIMVFTFWSSASGNKKYKIVSNISSEMRPSLNFLWDFEVALLNTVEIVGILGSVRTLNTAFSWWLSSYIALEPKISSTVFSVLQVWWKYDKYSPRRQEVVRFMYTLMLHFGADSGSRSLNVSLSTTVFSDISGHVTYRWNSLKH